MALEVYLAYIDAPLDTDEQRVLKSVPRKPRGVNEWETRPRSSHSVSSGAEPLAHRRGLAPAAPNSGVAINSKALADARKRALLVSRITRLPGGLWFPALSHPAPEKSLTAPPGLPYFGSADHSRKCSTEVRRKKASQSPPGCPWIRFWQRPRRAQLNSSFFGLLDLDGRSKFEFSST